MVKLLVIIFSILFFLHWTYWIISPDVKPKGRLAPREIVKKMKKHGAFFAEEGQNGVWYFLDKEGRKCRL